MAIDLKRLLRVTNPGTTLAVENPEDRQYYINFSSVRGGEIIGKIKKTIITFEGDDPSPSCHLFTGHIGCGKSTELLRLKYELEQEKFHVVYFASSEDLELSDVDIVDVLLAIARRVMQSLDQLQLEDPKGLKELLRQLAKFLNTEIDISAEGKFLGVEAAASTADGQFTLGAPIPGVGEVTVSQSGLSFVAAGIGSITAKAKQDSTLRDKVNQFFAPQKTQLLALINRELLDPGNARLRQLGGQSERGKGLVVIVDNLDRMDNSPRFKSDGSDRSQQEYLFIDQGEFLSKLNCHMVYTLPLSLNFCSEREILVQRLGDPRVLPMVPVKHQDGSECIEGMALLRQMVLARIFPTMSPEERLQHQEDIFDSSDSLDRLCRASGGHARNLLRLLNSWISEFELPLQRETLETVIRLRRSETSQAVNSISEEWNLDAWELLRQVQQRKNIGGQRAYQACIRSLLVYEYRDRGTPWFDVNPILEGVKELQV